MADYRPIVERLVFGLPEQDAAARAFAYDRARAALKSQFDSNLESAEQFEGEWNALNDAIADVETKCFAEDLQPAKPANKLLVQREDPTLAPSQPTPAPLRKMDGGRKGLVDVSPPARRLFTPYKLAAAAFALCALLVGVGTTGWQLSRSHRHAVAAMEYDVETVDGTHGAIVPTPVGSIEPAMADVVPSGIVAQRAALLIDAPQDPHRLRTYTGRVVWRFISTEQHSGRAGKATVEAAIDIPEAGFRAEVLFDKNATPELSASHTAQVRIARRPDSPVAKIDRIAPLEMRDAEAPIGIPLAGSQAMVTDEIFLIGLSDPDRKGANLRLIQSRPWFDLPIMFEGHREAKLTFEKGVSGDVVWTEALSAWR